MDLDSLRALVAVADAGSLLGGAERLGLARSTLRRRLDELEVLAGVPLLHRGAQGAALTAAGELLVSRGRGLLCLLYTSPSPRDRTRSRMPSSA